MPLSRRGGGRRGGRGGAGGAAGLARGAAAAAGAGGAGAARRSCCARREELVALVTADMGKTLADADGEVGRGIESVESAAAIPHLLKGETLEGVADGVDVEMVRQPVGVVAAITPVQLPGDDPALVPALRDRLRQRLHPQALRAGPAAGGADRRDRRLGRGDPGRGRQPRPRRARRGRPRSSRTRGSTRSPSSAGPRRRGSSPRARPRPASGCRRWAARRTRWS